MRFSGRCGEKWEILRFNLFGEMLKFRSVNKIGEFLSDFFRLRNSANRRKKKKIHATCLFGIPIAYKSRNPSENEKI